MVFVDRLLDFMRLMCDVTIKELLKVRAGCLDDWEMIQGGMETGKKFLNMNSLNC